MAGNGEPETGSRIPISPLEQPKKQKANKSQSTTEAIGFRGLQERKRSLVDSFPEDYNLDNSGEPASENHLMSNNDDSVMEVPLSELLREEEIQKLK